MDAQRIPNPYRIIPASVPLYIVPIRDTSTVLVVFRCLRVFLPSQRRAFSIR